MSEENIQTWKIQMSAGKFVVTVYAQDEERTVNALIDNGADPCSIVVEDGVELGTVDIRIIR